MSIKFFFNKTVDVMRLETTTGTDNEAFGATHLIGISCCIQPLDDSFGEDLSGSYGKDSLMFCAVQDIKEGDKIVDGATEYRVVGIESFFFINQSHMELRIRLTQ